MIRTVDGYEYETLADVLRDKKAESRYNQLYERTKRFDEACAEGFQRHYDRYLSLGYDRWHAADRALDTQFSNSQPQGPGSSGGAGQAGAGQAASGTVHPAN